MTHTNLSRRNLLKIGALTMAAMAFPLATETQAAPAATSGGGPFKLPPLPYPANALEPVIGKKTMQIHHGKHHQAYIDKLNKALEAHPDYQKWPVEELLKKLEELPESLRKDVRNQGGGHHNHTLFWESMAPPKTAKASKLSKELEDAIVTEFGSFDKFKTAFQDAGGSVFGSGWVWLAADPKTGKVAVKSTANQDSVLSAGWVPLLGNDVWEHAYYLNYQNRRADYLKAWWDVVNWNVVAERYAKVKA